MSFLVTGISAVATIAGTLVSMQGQRNAADAANKTANYNATIQRNQAAQELEVAKENARRKARDNSRIIGQQRAALAQSGLAMDGTPLAVLGETSMTLQRDILDMGYEAQTRSNALQASANMGLWNGQNQAAALRTEALTTGLAGVAKVTNGFMQAKGKY